jgi:hypothetical protein
MRPRACYKFPIFSLLPALSISASLAFGQAEDNNEPSADNPKRGLPFASRVDEQAPADLKELRWMLSQLDKESGKKDPLADYVEKPSSIEERAKRAEWKEDDEAYATPKLFKQSASNYASPDLQPDLAKRNPPAQSGSTNSSTNEPTQRARVESIYDSCYVPVLKRAPIPTKLVSSTPNQSALRQEVPFNSQPLTLPGLGGQGQPAFAAPPPTFTNPGMAPPGMAPPGMAPPGMAPPGMAPPGMAPPGMVNPGAVNPGFANPGAVNPALVNPSMVNPVLPNGAVGGVNNGLGGVAATAPTYNPPGTGAAPYVSPSTVAPGPYTGIPAPAPSNPMIIPSPSGYTNTPLSGVGNAPGVGMVMPAPPATYAPANGSGMGGNQRPTYDSTTGIVNTQPFVSAPPCQKDARYMVSPTVYRQNVGCNTCSTQPYAPTSGSGSPFSYVPTTSFPGAFNGYASQYRPLIGLGQDVRKAQLGRGIIGQPVAYMPSQPLRNVLRYLFP